MKLYEHKYMDFVLKEDRIDFTWKEDTADMDDYAFMKSYDEAVGWLND